MFVYVCACVRVFRYSRGRARRRSRSRKRAVPADRPLGREPRGDRHKIWLSQLQVYLPSGCVSACVCFSICRSFKIESFFHHPPHLHRIFVGFFRAFRWAQRTPLAVCGRVYPPFGLRVTFQRFFMVGFVIHPRAGLVCGTCLLAFASFLLGCLRSFEVWHTPLRMCTNSFGLFYGSVSERLRCCGPWSVSPHDMKRHGNQSQSTWWGNDVTYPEHLGTL